MKPEQRAEKYRAIAAEIRTIIRFVSVDDVRASLLNLASAYERLADTAEYLELPAAVDDSTHFAD